MRREKEGPSLTDVKAGSDSLPWLKDPAGGPGGFLLARNFVQGLDAGTVDGDLRRDIAAVAFHRKAFPH